MRLSLRNRMLLAALLPVFLVATGLTVLFAYRHLTDLDAALEQRGQALARQAAVTAEFSLFTGNREFLQAMAFGVLRTDSDVIGIAITDSIGEVVAQAGAINRTQWPTLTIDSQLPGVERVIRHATGDVIAAPVMQKTLAVDDPYSGAEVTVVARASTVLGFVVLEVSRQRVLVDRQRLLILALLTGIGGALLGGALAMRIARGVTRPVLEATEVVDRIGHGDLSARIDETRAGPLSVLAGGINAMANRVAITQDELGRQIQEAVAELVKQRDTAEQATLAKSRFLASASHDLRQPLHALGLFVSRLSNQQWNDEQQGLIRHVESSVNTLQELLDTLLDISRLDAGAYRTHLQTFELTPLLERLVTELAPLAYEKKLVFRLRSRPVSIESDPRLVERVVINLLSNAIRHTHHGSVLLAVRTVGGKVRLQVWDTGDGIPPEMQKSIFDEYVQIGNDERDRGKGLGLGLSICQRIAGVLGTGIGLRSRPGHGSVFWIDLPLRAPAPVRAVSNATEDGLLHGRVLVVDDDVLCREATAEVIAGWGAEVATAHDAEVARSAIRTAIEIGQLPDIVICDVRLPGGTNGMDLAQELRRSHPDLKIVLISADVTPAVQAVARRNGFPLLKKPVAPARLRATLLSLLPV